MTQPRLLHAGAPAFVCPLAMLMGQTLPLLSFFQALSFQCGVATSTALDLLVAPQILIHCPLICGLVGCV